MKQTLLRTVNSATRGMVLIVALVALMLPASVSAEGSAGSVLNDLGINVSGFLDLSATHNFNNPTDRGNFGRIFDGTDDDFSLNQAQILVEREGVAGKGMDAAGFVFRLGFGQDAAAFNSTPFDGDEIAIEEAYVTYAFTDKLQGRIGQYVTLLGAEVIESKDNFNFSRSFLFNFAIPLTHTGVRFTYAPSDMLEMNLGIVNGWDNLVENNNAKSLEANVVLNLPGNVSWSHAVIHGVEGDETMAGDFAGQRTVYDTVLSYQPHAQWTFVGNFDYGSEQGASLVNVGTDAQWWGVAGYTHYDATDRLGFTVRGEVFDDQDGARLVDAFDEGAMGAGVDQTVWETTLTAAYKLTASLETRLEYRYDKSNVANAFGAGENNQSTIAAEVIFTF